MMSDETSADPIQRYWIASHNAAVVVFAVAVVATVLVGEYWILLAALAVSGVIVGLGELLERKWGDGFVRR